MAGAPIQSITYRTNAQSRTHSPRVRGVANHFPDRNMNFDGCTWMRLRRERRPKWRDNGGRAGVQCRNTSTGCAATREDRRLIVDGVRGLDGVTPALYVTWQVRGWQSWNKKYVHALTACENNQVMPSPQKIYRFNLKKIAGPNRLKIKAHMFTFFRPL